MSLLSDGFLDAIYPVLFLDYVFQMWTSAENGGISDNFRFMLLSLTSIGLGFLNWLGLNVVGNMTIVIGLLSMAPFVIMVLIGMFKVDPSRWREVPTTTVDGQDVSDQGMWAVFTSGVILWRPLLNSLFWNLNSYDATASYSAEVRDPGYVLPRALMWGVVIMTAGYIFPILVAIGATDSEPEDWVDGYLTTAAEQIGGKWLGAWVVFAAGVSNIGMFQAELSADAFQLMGMAERGFVPKIFATRSRHGTPTYGIILGVAVIVAMGSFNLEQLIEMLNFNYALALLLEYGAFMRLRIAKPEGMSRSPNLCSRITSSPSKSPYQSWVQSIVHRPFRIPLGTIGSGIFLSFPVIGILIILSMASYMTMIFSLGINLAGLLIFYFYRGTSFSLRGCCSYSKVPVDNPTTVEPSDEVSGLRHID